MCWSLSPPPIASFWAGAGTLSRSFSKIYYNRTLCTDLAGFANKLAGANKIWAQRVGRCGGRWRRRRAGGRSTGGRSPGGRAGGYRARGVRGWGLRRG